jgi:hypothetical protein
MRTLTTIELNQITGAGCGYDNISPALIEWNKDGNGKHIPTWTPNGSLRQDAFDACIMAGYLVFYKHFDQIFPGK